jgi:hypothetical protein
VAAVLGGTQRTVWRRCSDQSPDKERHVSRIKQVIETLEAERTEVQEHLTWIEQRIEELSAHGDDPPRGTPARSVRRSTARRASSRRATARGRHVDVTTRIVAYLAQHPGSTAGDVARGLNLQPGGVGTRLTRLVKAGEIDKATRGYAAK